jgi:two-component system C4-dicarboxylate transport response regulator DctD
VVELFVPPLRERTEDVPLLFEYFVSAAAQAHGREPRPVSLATTQMLLAHRWPGNVRELRNAAERYALGLAESFTPRRPAEVGSRSLAQQVEAFERAVIERCLEETGGKISAVMERLDIPRRTLSEKMARLGLTRRQFVDPNGPNLADAPLMGSEKPPIT